jgi:hypothetical protein
VNEDGGSGGACKDEDLAAWSLAAAAISAQVESLVMSGHDDGCPKTDGTGATTGN